jgi:DNA processing protein
VDRDELAQLLMLLSTEGVSRRVVRRIVAQTWQRGGTLRDAAEVISRDFGGRHLQQTEVRQDLSLVDRLGLSVVTMTQKEYPEALATIPDPPIALFCRGDIGVLARPLAVAVVGSRRASAEGSRLAHALAEDIAGAGVTVVSGLAVGIDAAAHRGALAKVGVTVAVIGGGHSRTYPSQHRGLADAIVAGGGAVIGEYLPTDAPRRNHFPERNRVISGLCAGVVVVEATVRSGSLITARMALEQGREVMAVPGAIENGRHGGCHRLIRDGALLVEGTEDVLLGFGVAVPVPRRAAPENPLLASVLAAMPLEVAPVHQLVERLALPVQQVLAALAELEIDGFVQASGDGYIRRA